MVFKRTLIFMLIMVVLSITGCVNCTIKINEQDDGSANIYYQVMIDKVANRLISDQGVNPIDNLKQTALINGFIVKDLTQDNATGYTAEKHVASVTEIPDLISVFGLSGTDQSAPFKINKSIFYRKLDFNENIDLSGLYGQPGSEAEQLAQTLTKNASFKLMYTTSHPAVNSNSNVVINNGDTKTYVWNIDLGKQNQINLATKTLQTGNVAALAVLGLVISYCVGMFIYLGRKEGQSRQHEAAESNAENVCVTSTSG